MIKQKYLYLCRPIVVFSIIRNVMGKLEKYKIDLKGMKENTLSCDFKLDNSFFADIDVNEITKGNLTVKLEVKRTASVYELSFQTEGYVVVTCDRCLDEMEQPISTNDKLRVKFGDDYSEDGEVVIIPEDEGIINVAWFIYEFIALSIPIKHTHAIGKCNSSMMKALNKHSVHSVEDDSEWQDEISEEMDEKADDDKEPVDPRWNELKKIIDK